MAQITTIQIQGSESAQTANAKYIRNAADDRDGIRVLGDYLHSIAAGIFNANVKVTVADGNGTAASKTVTCLSTAASNDTIVIGGVTFTSRTTATTAIQVALSTTPSTLATNLVTKINAYSVFASVLTAAASTSIATITYSTAGRAGNLVTLTETGNGYTLGGATLTGATATVVSAIRTYNAGK